MAGPDSLLSRALAMVRGRFAANAGGLAAASLVNQGLSFVTFLYIAWAFTQEEIGEYSIFLAYHGIIHVCNLLSYQWGIPNAEEGRGLRDLLVLLLALAGLSAALVAVGFYLAGYEQALWLALLTAVRSLSTICEQLNIRRQSYRAIMFFRVFPSVLILGLVPALAIGYETSTRVLVLSYLGGHAVGGVLYAVHSLRGEFGNRDLPSPKVREIWAVAVRERRFSLWLMPSEVLNKMAYDLPTILIGHFMGNALAAQYAVTLKMCMGPVALVGSALGQTYHGYLAGAVRGVGDKGPGLYNRLSKALVVIGLATALGAAFVAPPMVELLLGPQWQLAEDLIRIMAPLYGIMVFVGPLSMALVVFEKQQFLFWSQLAYMLISLASFGLAIFLQDLVVGAACFMALSLVRYGVVQWKVVQVHRNWFARGQG